MLDVGEQKVEEQLYMYKSTGVCKIIAQRATVSNGSFFSVAGYCL